MSVALPPPLSLYIHFPWCVRKCPYCDFNSYTLHGDLGEASYVAALETDLEAQAAGVLGREVVSIFLGGGTPSLFSPAAIAAVLDSAGKLLRLAPDVEVTMEVNPGTLERGRFDEYRSAGVTRVSLGAQSFDDEQLQALGRIHSSDETRRAAEELHSAGLRNFNLDLMYALPGQSVSAALRDVQEALSLQPAHLSHYQLTIEQGTVFAGHPPPALPDEDVAADMLVACRDRLAADGFAQYEVSAYALAGRRCRHNLNYWTFGDYLGVGAGAHGKLTAPGPRKPASVVRTQQSRDPRRFVANPTGITRTATSSSELPFEFMLNALRLVDGFERALFCERTGLEWGIVEETIRALAARGLLEIDQTSCRPTARGLQLLNELLLSFLEEKPKTTGSFALSTAL